MRVEALTERIFGLIKQGHLKPGNRLPPETQLVKQLKVGRSSIREALRGLSMLGIVSARPKRGTVVISPIDNILIQQINSSVVYWAVHDLFEVRAVLEGYAAGEAARYANAAQIAEIAKAASGMEKKVRLRKNYFKENYEFHAAIARAA